MNQETKREQGSRTANICPDHGYDCLSNRTYDPKSGEEICGITGVIVSESFDRRPERRAFTQQEKDSRRRVGHYPSYSTYDKGLSTKFDIDRDSHGRELSPEIKRQMRRLKQQDIRSRISSSVNRNLYYAMAELDRLSDKAHIPSPMKEKAAVIYRKALDKGDSHIP